MFKLPWLPGLTVFVAIEAPLQVHDVVKLLMTSSPVP
jgi:hypothetical protein